MGYLIECGPSDDLQQMIDNLPDDGQEALVKLQEGVYPQRLTIRRSHTTLQGAGKEKTIITGALRAREILEDGYKRGTFRTYTVLTDADAVVLRDLTIENAASPIEEAGQAIALYADGPSLTVENCRLKSFQDTLFTAPLPEKEIEPRGFIGPKENAPRTPSRQLYRNCEILGQVDFIFGGAQALFENCNIISIDGRADRSAPYRGYVCAPSTPPAQAEGYRFVGCRFEGSGVPDGSVFLARPWREGAMAVFEHCELGPHIHPEGFCDWADRGKNGLTRFLEQGSFGPGALGQRIGFAEKLP